MIFLGSYLIGNEKLEIFLYFLIGICCCRANIPAILYILKSDINLEGVTGKAMYFEIIKSILGNSYSSYTLEELAGNTPTIIYGKTCNVSKVDFAPDKFNFNNFRNLLTSNTRNVKSNYNTLTFKPYTTMILDVYNINEIEDILMKLSKNFKVIPIHDFIMEDTDTLLQEDNLRYIVMKSLQVVRELVITSKSLDIPNVIEQETQKYKLDNNHVLEFFDTFPIKEVYNSDRYYEDYEKWCSLHYYNAIPKSELGKYLPDTYTSNRYSFNGNRGYHYYFKKAINIEECKKKYSKQLKNLGYDVSKDNRGHLFYYLSQIFVTEQRQILDTM